MIYDRNQLLTILRQYPDARVHVMTVTKRQYHYCTVVMCMAETPVSWYVVKPLIDREALIPARTQYDTMSETQYVLNPTPWRQTKGGET